MLQLLLLLVGCWVGLSVVVQVILYDKFIQGISKEVKIIVTLKMYSASMCASILKRKIINPHW
jgi:hypothetical protein